MDKIQIHPLRDSDFDKVAELFDQYRQFYKQQSDKEAAKVFLDNRLKNKEIMIFTAHLDTNIVGFTNIYPTFSSVQMKPAWTLNDLYVHKDFRRTGIAEALIQHVQGLAKEKNISHLQLETAPDNKAAQAFYKQTGWQQSEFYTYYYDTGSDS